MLKEFNEDMLIRVSAAELLEKKLSWETICAFVCKTIKMINGEIRA